MKFAREPRTSSPSLAALGIMVLPLSEVVLRRFFNTGVPGAAPFTAHLTLIVGLVGAAIAAREGKLLALATGTMLPEGRPRHLAGDRRRIRRRARDDDSGARRRAASAGSLARPAKEIALGVPIWVADLAFPDRVRA